jgi:hypothetical protein
MDSSALRMRASTAPKGAWLRGPLGMGDDNGAPAPPQVSVFELEALDTTRLGPTTKGEQPVAAQGWVGERAHSLCHHRGDLAVCEPPALWRMYPSEVGVDAEAGRAGVDR